MRSYFRKFKEFLSEKNDPRNSEIDTCSRCGEETAKCTCIDDDYYDAKVLHYADKGEKKKGPHKSQQ